MVIGSDASGDSDLERVLMMRDLGGFELDLTITKRSVSEVFLGSRYEG